MKCARMLVDEGKAYTCTREKGHTGFHKCHRNDGSLAKEWTSSLHSRKWVTKSMQKEFYE